MGHLLAVAANKFSVGLPRPNARRAFEQLPLREALERTWCSDAHCTQYIETSSPDGRQYRLTKREGGRLAGVEYCAHVLLADVDNPDHADWTPALRAATRPKLARLETVGWFETLHGLRLVQPLTEPIHVDDVERYLEAWFTQIREAGLSPDPACRDWPRLMRMPNVMRDRRPYRSEIHLERMRPLTVTPVPIATDLPVARNVHATRHKRRELPWASSCPADWEERAQLLAEGVLRHAAYDVWHQVFLALSGALLKRRVPSHEVPAIIGRVAQLADDSRIRDRVNAARTTIDRYDTGEPFTAFGSLPPGLADVVRRVTATASEAKLYAAVDVAAVPPPDLATEQARLRQALRSLPDGVTGIVAPCGFGKTVAVTEFATDRVQILSESRLNTHTSITCPTNALAAQVYEGLAVQHRRRLFGPMSVTGDDACRVRHLLPLVEGGQSVRRHWCPSCDYAATCVARVGIDGDPDGAQVVTTHAKIAEASRAAGKTGVLVIDEPPSLLTSASFTRADFANVVQFIEAGYFEPTYAATMRPAVEALRAWLEAPTGQPEPVDVRGCFAGDADTHATDTSPRIRRHHLHLARASGQRNERLGAASKLLSAVYDWSTAAHVEGFAMRAHARVDAGRLHLLWPNLDLVAALRREGRVVLLDASLAVNAAIVERVIGYPLPVHTFDAADGAPVERVILRTGSATKAGWLAPDGSPTLGPGFVDALTAALDFAAGSVAVITMRAIETYLLAAVATDELTDEQRERVAALEPGERRRAVHVLGPILHGRTVRFGHFGGLRGLNHMADCDAVVTLGDPRPNVGQVEAEIALTGIEETVDARVEAMAAAELEQAHGRLRTIHRTKPARAIHVGGVLPSGRAWAGVPVRELKEPADLETLKRLVDAVGGVSAAARVVGMSRSTVSRALSGERAAPTAMTRALRQFVSGQAQPLPNP